MRGSLKKASMAFCLSATILCAVSALAQTEVPPQPVAPVQPAMPDWVSKLSIDGRGFLRYSYELDETKKSFNEFDVDRVYLGVTWKQSDLLKVRYVLEGGNIRQTETTQDSTSKTITQKEAKEYNTVTKLFYLEVADLLYKDSFAKFGLHDLPWVGYVDGLWGYRFQGSNLADKSGYLTSTDMGIAVGGKIASDFGAWQVSLVNGEGWKKDETGQKKDVHLRINLTPFAGSEGFLSGFVAAVGGAYGNYDDIAAPDSAEKVRYNALLGFKKKGVATFLAEYLAAKDPASKLKSKYASLASKGNQTSESQSYAAYASLNLGALGLGEAANAWELIGRYEMVDPDNNIDDNGVKRWMAGVAYAWNKNITSALDFEEVTGDAASGQVHEGRVMLQTDLKL